MTACMRACVYSCVHACGDILVKFCPEFKSQMTSRKQPLSLTRWSDCKTAYSF